MSWLVLRASLRSFTDNRGMQSAATLAYFGFRSLMPLLLLAVYFLGLFVASSEKASAALAETVRGLYPDFNDAILADIAKIATTKAWGVVSILFLAWSITPFAAAMRAALLGIFKSDAKIHFVKSQLRDIHAVLWLMNFFLLFAFTRIFAGALPSWLLWIKVIDWIIPPVITAVILAFLFRVFSPQRLPWRTLFIGGISGAILLTIMRPLFGLILRYNPGFGYAFGSLKTIFLLLVWVFYLFAAILLAAEIMANYHRRESLLLRKLFLAPGGKLDPLIERFVKTLADGADLFSEGDSGSEMFYVLTGEIELRKGGNVVKVAKPGDYFGEMSLLLSAPRTASAVARGETRLVAINRANFETITRESPAIVMTLLQEMARRLKTTTDALATKA